MGTPYFNLPQEMSQEDGDEHFAQCEIYPNIYIYLHRYIYFAHSERQIAFPKLKP